MKIGKKTVVTRELTRQEKNRRNNIKRLTVSFIVAFLLFIALVVIQSSILNQEAKHEVFQVVKDMPIGTKITSDNLNKYIKLKDVQISLIPEGYITDKKDILGKFTNRAYKANDIITSDGITDVEKMYKDSIVNPTELSFSVSDTSAAVSGTIHEGDYVNIYGLRKDAFNDGELASESDELILTDEYFSFMHVYVAEAYDGDGNRIGTDDTTDKKAVMFTIILSEDDVKTFNEMLKNCDVRMAKIIYDSDKTYLDFIKEVNLEAGSFKKSQAAQERKKYNFNIDANTEKYPEAGNTNPVDYSEQTQKQLDEEEKALDKVQEQAQEVDKANESVKTNESDKTQASGKSDEAQETDKENANK